MLSPAYTRTKSPVNVRSGSISARFGPAVTGVELLSGVVFGRPVPLSVPKGRICTKKQIAVTHSIALKPNIAPSQAPRIGPTIQPAVRAILTIATTPSLDWLG